MPFSKFHNIQEVKGYRIEIVSNDSIIDIIQDNKVEKNNSIMLLDKNSNVELDIIFQTVDNLHKACKNHKGDWYFTGNYPTPGGNKVVNQAFINFVEGKSGRAY